MIQSVAPTFSSPSTGRPSSRSAGDGPAFALPVEGNGSAILLAGAGGGERQDDAVPGKSLPIGPATTDEPRPLLALTPAPSSAPTISPAIVTPPPAALAKAAVFAGAPAPAGRPFEPTLPTDASTADDPPARDMADDDPAPSVPAVADTPPLVPGAVVLAGGPPPTVTVPADTLPTPAAGDPPRATDDRPRSSTSPTSDRVARATPPTDAVTPAEAGTVTEAPPADPAWSAAAPSKSLPAAAITPSLPRQGSLRGDDARDTAAASPRLLAEEFSRVKTLSLESVSNLPVATSVTAPLATVRSTLTTGASAASMAMTNRRSIDPMVIATATASIAPPVPLPRSWTRPAPAGDPGSPAATPYVSPATPRPDPVAPVVATMADLTAPVAPASSPSEPTASRQPTDARSSQPAVVSPPSQPLPTAPSAAPAAIVFGAARFAAQTAEDRDEPATPLGTAPLVAPMTLDRAVAAASATPPLDMTRERWPHAMIERIEMIRDAADAADTRIRLIPDALGPVDVEVRRNGDTLDVRFRAEQPQTRALLADAAPRLAEAAEARGLRLGQTSVGGDAASAGQGQHGQRQPAPLPAAPPRAPRSPVADVPVDDDLRLA